ncbi:MAG: alpha-amylase/4-alpha-glucanotransferase domain-containing protein, partial [Thermodesulfobacteriota bacterium]
DWIEEHHPEFIELLKKMVDRGQVEMLGGGYFEPILSVIPEQDRLGQLLMMSERIEGLFGVRPRGAWLAERVWEPTLPSTLKSAGIEYVVLDDYHFTRSGLKPDELDGYFITEDQGRVIKVFPGSEKLRYLMPFKPVEMLKEHLGELSKNGPGSMVLYADDGEKFGVWPGTKKWVFDDGWLERFLKKIKSMKGTVRPVTFSEYMDEFKPRGRVYLPTTSYMEMGEWTLPSIASGELSALLEDIGKSREAEKLKRFIQGGAWRNFFSKYAESNWMHKRMIMVSRALEDASDRRKNSAAYKRAGRHLYMAQSNDPFWHGIFGGLYMPHLRGAAYENLLEAEGALNQELPSIELIDVDADGVPEAILRSEHLNLFVNPARGGAIEEIDFKPASINLSNTLTRRPEAYHAKLREEAAAAARAARGTKKKDGVKSIHDLKAAKEEGLEEYLLFDTQKRASFVDRFLDPGLTLDDFIAGAYEELGDFSDSAYSEKVKKGKVELVRSGAVGAKEVTVKKTVSISGASSFEVSYSLDSASSIEESGKKSVPQAGKGKGPVRFAIEINLILPACAGPACSYTFSPPSLMPETEADLALSSRGELTNVKGVELIDSFTGVKVGIETKERATLWRYPIETVSLSESGFEKIFQGSSLLFIFPVDLDVNKDGAIFKNSFVVSIENLS